MTKTNLGLGVLVVLVLCVIASQCNFRNTIKPEVVYKTDTIIVEKIKIVQIEKATKPEKVYVQSKPDTVYRKVVEKQIINIGTSISDGVLRVQTIDSLGNIKEKEFSVKPTDKITLNNEGEAEITPDKKALRKEKRKKFLRRVGQVALVVGGIFLGTIL